jgi:hypothetical protein
MNNFNLLSARKKIVVEFEIMETILMICLKNIHMS